MTPDPLDPNVYQACVRRVMDDGKVVCDVDLGFGHWILSSKYPGGQEAKCQQGRYRLDGIARLEPGARDMIRDLAGGAPVTAYFRQKNKHYLASLFVKTLLPEDDPARSSGPFIDQGVALELASMPGTSDVVKSLAKEVVRLSSLLMGGEGVVDVNKLLIEKGLAIPRSPHERH